MKYHLYTYNVGVDDPISIRDHLLSIYPEQVIFDADRLICDTQVEMALTRAERSRKQKKMIAKIWGIEVVLHLAGTHQISEALDLLGIRSTTSDIGLIASQPVSLIDRMTEGLIIGPPSDELLRDYKLISVDPCMEIVSRGVGVVINHQ